MLDQDLPSTISELSTQLSQDGSFGKTYRVSFQQTKEWISGTLPKSLPVAGLAYAGEYLTLSGLELVSDAEESFLSDILETGDLPTKYYLSPKACQGILRRSKERGKTLPERLRLALERQAQEQPA